LYAVQITNAKDIRFELEKAYYISMEGRRGPVLLDIPMNIQREEIEVDKLRCYQVQGNDRGSATEGCYNRDTLLEDCCNREAVSDDCCNREAVSDDRYDRNVTEDCNNREAMTDNRYDIIIQELEKAERPCMLVGAGIKNSGLVYEFRRLAMSLGIPVVSSMIAADIMKKDSSSYYGFIGAYGHRSANFIVAKCDLLISIGSRLDCRQTGVNKEIFAPNAKLVRIDIDENELTNRIKENEIQIVDQLTSEKLNSLILKIDTNLKKDYSSWKSVCAVIDSSLKNYDNNKIQDIMKKMCSYIPDNVVITTDVGQNQVWISQGFEFKENQMALYTGGHGAMGYSLPAAIGAYYASKKSVYCFTGDGGIQMNIQELEFVKREKLPIKIIIMNNYSLGMIRHFQEIYFDANYYQTGKNNGYSVPDFEKIAYAYDISYVRIKEIDQISGDLFINPAPTITEFVLDYDTYVFPKLSMGRPCQDQDPLIDRELYDYLMKI